MVAKKVLTKDFLSILDKKNTGATAVISSTELEVDTKPTDNTLLEENQRLKAELFELSEKLKRYEDAKELDKELESLSSIEQKYKKLQKEHEELKEKVKRDLRLIKERERELSNRIEILKQDNEALLHSKDNQILKLKKKLDDMQYQLSVSQDKVQKLKRLKGNYEDKLKQILRSLKISASLIESVQKELEEDR